METTIKTLFKNKCSSDFIKDDIKFSITQKSEAVYTILVQTKTFYWLLNDKTALHT